MMIRLVSPFPPEHVPFLWDWLNEFPQYNFDDSGPKNVNELAEVIKYRQENGEIVWEALQDGIAVGAIGFKRLSLKQAIFKGIVFTQYTHGSGIPREAVSMVLNLAFQDGVQIVRAEYFASNKRIQKFLEKFGGTVADYIPCGSVQNGVLIDWKVSEILAADYYDYIRANSGQGSDQTSSV